MRYIAVSDSHGDRETLKQCIAQALQSGTMDGLLFLGDGIGDLDAVRPMIGAGNAKAKIIAVRGNNDFCCGDAPTTAETSMDGHRLFLCHGHAYRVKWGLESLCYAAREREAEVALFGHTHCSHLETVYGVTMLNPGAVDSRNPFAYAELISADQKLRINLIPKAF